MRLLYFLEIWQMELPDILHAPRNALCPLVCQKSNKYETPIWLNSKYCKVSNADLFPKLIISIQNVCKTIIPFRASHAQIIWFRATRKLLNICTISNYSSHAKVIILWSIWRVLYSHWKKQPKNCNKKEEKLKGNLGLLIIVWLQESQGNWACCYWFRTSFTSLQM